MEVSLKIGEKLRQLRKEYGLTQEELANRAYLTKGFISQLERDLTSPSIATLKSMLDVLGVDMGNFFRDVPQQSVVARKKARVLSSMSTDECEIHFLLPKAMGRLMDPVLVTLDSGARTEDDSSHEGEEFGIVLQGTITLWLDGKAHRLLKGDCFYFKSSWNHWVENSGSHPARIMWVVSPSTF
jgi:transcriptional regulator with XRE-family HTH domain